MGEKPSAPEDSEQKQKKTPKDLEQQINDLYADLTPEQKKSGNFDTRIKKIDTIKGRAQILARQTVLRDLEDVRQSLSSDRFKMRGIRDRSRINSTVLDGVLDGTIRTNFNKKGNELVAGIPKDTSEKDASAYRHYVQQSLNKAITSAHQHKESDGQTIGGFYNKALKAAKLQDFAAWKSARDSAKDHIGDPADTDPKGMNTARKNDKNRKYTSEKPATASIAHAAPKMIPVDDPDGKLFGVKTEKGKKLSQADITKGIDKRLTDGDMTKVMKDLMSNGSYKPGDWKDFNKKFNKALNLPEGSGDKGIKALQRHLGIKVDGKFGPETRKALFLKQSEKALGEKMKDSKFMIKLSKAKNPKDRAKILSDALGAGKLSGDVKLQKALIMQLQKNYNKGKDKSAQIKVDGVFGEKTAKALEPTPKFNAGTNVSFKPKSTKILLTDPQKPRTTTQLNSNILGGLKYTNKPHQSIKGKEYAQVEDPTAQKGEQKYYWVATSDLQSSKKA